MTSVDDLRDFFKSLNYTLIIAADGETRTHKQRGSRIIEQTPAGGVSVAFDVVCQAAGATYVARAKSDADRLTVDDNNSVTIEGRYGRYCLKRIFLSEELEETYYTGFSNQSLWPLSHVVFERPTFNAAWYEGYAEVNRMFAAAIQPEIEDRTFIWVNDYQLALVPSYLEKRPDTVIGLFWHIPWPTWEIFRILPHKREILQSFLACDYVGFHRRYQARNFLNAVDHELGARIDYETNTVFFEGKSVRVGSHPMGIDVDVIRDVLAPEDEDESTGLLQSIRTSFGMSSPGTPAPERRPAEATVRELCERYRVMVGVDRLDYTKGIKERLMGLDRFFELYPQYRGKAVYIGIMSPTRDTIPAYQQLKSEVAVLTGEINDRYREGSWEPLHMVYEGFTREDVIDLYRQADACLVTPLDDGMNLVSKEFVVAASCSEDPGMLVLSQFAGSATDLTASVLVNPYDTDAVAEAIKTALEMPLDERTGRIEHMMTVLEDHNVYEWAMSFMREAAAAARDQQLELLQLG